jgi:ABC-type lipoprotein release transport system permease subunit
MLLIAFRNTIRNFQRYAPLFSAVATIIFFLLLGNSILTTINQNFSQNYRQHLSGDLLISADSKGSFTLFGSDELLVRDYFMQPTFSIDEELVALVESNSSVTNTTIVYSLLSSLELRGFKENFVLLGVDFDTYGKLFPDLNVIIGSIPQGGSTGILIPKDFYDIVERTGARAPRVGDPVLITSPTDTSFSIREVPVSGVIEYPMTNSQLNVLGIIDIRTARELVGVSGYKATDQDASIDLNNLFSDAGDDEEDSDTGFSLSSIENLVSQSSTLSEDPEGSIFGSVTHMLIRVEENNLTLVMNELQQLLPADLKVKIWRDGIGGSAFFVYLLQVIFNFGIIIIVVGSVIVVVNTIVLSIIDRYKEIGTMRAVGAEKSYIARLIVSETSLLLIPSILLGLLIGFLAVKYLNSYPIEISNRYLQDLVGSDVLVPSLSLSIFITHFLASLIVVLIAAIYPVYKAIRVSPIDTLREAL